MEMYPVFEVDICFESYAADDVLIGAKDADDLRDHLDKIYAPEKYNYTDEDGNEKQEIYRKFTSKQLKEIKKKHENSMFDRIRPIEHMFTDTPYTVLISYGYCE